MTSKTVVLFIFYYLLLLVLLSLFALQYWIPYSFWNILLSNLNASATVGLFSSKSPPLTYSDSFIQPHPLKHIFCQRRDGETISNLHPPKIRIIPITDTVFHFFKLTSDSLRKSILKSFGNFIFQIANNIHTCIKLLEKYLFC